ncbi:hypothetical protein [Myroides odoratus]|uniref:Uncharacterized protein n=1 Tax=Myroides odoratus TaxID=256 RepID=A0A9Q7E921_MYROD|nr:hypothetical protein [Myroides odoratus]EHQ44025.1 hypothetical protein Myrod_3212 [Myroides odoratus DSM 2801]EKB05327.1 hypothetical protein HMPREF9716_02881 [Myroides odoratus CIP 103059]QQU01321.1 hypothetical protein I6I88_06135 [Myroides odoratus]WQD56415.1 hypothetical protein U0010_12880 [Myroides odoratus]STZ31307.1 Uncharacterised protein [Myroides odoratus]
MKKKIEYSFDDEPISKFCYDLDTQKIEINFRGYYDLIKDVYINASCIWVLKDWEYAKIKVGDDPNRYELANHLGIFSLILYMKYNDDQELEMLVITVDNKYITLIFKEPKLSLKINNNIL